MDLIARRPSVSSSLLRNVFANAHTIATSRAVLYIQGQRQKISKLKKGILYPFKCAEGKCSRNRAASMREGPDYASRSSMPASVPLMQEPPTLAPGGSARYARGSVLRSFDPSALSRLELIDLAPLLLIGYRCLAVRSVLVLR